MKKSNTVPTNQSLSKGIHTKDCCLVKKTHNEYSQSLQLLPQSRRHTNIKNGEECQQYLSHSTPNLNQTISYHIEPSYFCREYEKFFYSKNDVITFIDEEEEEVEKYSKLTQKLQPISQDEHFPAKSKSLSIRHLSVKIKLQMHILQDLTNQHDQHYLSVNFGEDVIKEMIMSSIYGTSIKTDTALFAYRVMMQRVQRVARNFSRFNVLPLNIQDVLLQQNSDFIISLYGAAFFQYKQAGFDQILGCLSYEDHDIATSTMASMKQNFKANYKDYKGILYNNFNSIQEKPDNTPAEKRYNKLLSKIGSYVIYNQLYMKLLVYILLLSLDFDDSEIVMDQRTKDYIDKSQRELITVLEGCIFETYSRKSAENLFSGLLESLTDLKELCYIKKKRRLAQLSSQTLISSV